MQRHLIAFDLDETLSSSHIYAAVTSRIQACQKDILDRGRKRDLWAFVAEMPKAEFERQKAVKQALIDENKKKIAACEAGIVEEDLRRNEKIISADEGVPKKLERSESISSSSDNFFFQVLEPEAMIANYRSRIADYERENVQLQGELEAASQHPQEAIEAIKQNARDMIAQLDKESREVSAHFMDLVQNIETQWEIIKDVKVMCDQPLLQALISELQRDGHRVAIATFNSFKPLVTKFLKDKCGLTDENLLMDCLNPDTQRERNKEGKNNHLKRIVGQCHAELCQELNGNRNRVILIDDSVTNIERAKEAGFGTFHFDPRAMIQSEDIAANAQNAYLAFLIVKFGYEEKLSEHIGRLKLGPMIDHIKLQIQKEDLKKSASIPVGSRAALQQAGILPTVRSGGSQQGQSPQSPGPHKK